MRRCEFFVYKIGKQHPHKVGYNDAGMTDYIGSTHFIAQHAHVQFHSYNKHKKHKTHLAENVQVVERFGSKEELIGFGIKIAQQRWSE